jgi:hypothetical protein
LAGWFEINSGVVEQAESLNNLNVKVPLPPKVPERVAVSYVDCPSVMLVAET